MTKRKPHEIDIHVGQKIKLAMHKKGMTQEKLAKHAGVSFQQIQKYCNGKNRVCASRLYQIAQALNLSMSYFFPSSYEGADIDIPAIIKANKLAKASMHDLKKVTKKYDELMGDSTHDHDPIETLKMVARDTKKLMDGKIDPSKDPDFLENQYAHCMKAIENAKD